MKTIEFPLLPGAQCLGFAAKGTHHTNLAHLYFRVLFRLLFVQTLFVSLGSVVAAFSIELGLKGEVVHDC